MKPLMEVKRIRRYFGGIRALDSVSLSIPAGKLTALIGPNGAGKTTLFNVIAGLMEADSGEILLEGKSIAHLATEERARLGIARTFQSVRLFKNLTVEDHFALALSQGDDDWGGMIENEKQQQEYRKQGKEIMQILGLEKQLTDKAADLSYGQRKLMDLGMALVRDPKLLMLDEPVAGVNPGLRKKIQNILKKLKKYKRTILLVEHDMEFVMDVADRVIVMDAGKIIAEGNPSQIRSNPKVLEAYLGE
ncbi:MAG TPA: ABC transporter ATP-binding protein [Candidatus Bilamarchaeaceae archaeon]|nr:ABC transporter ATP-binding protein [Candidatus Bilamarchaeaceae archaeon]